MFFSTKINHIASWGQVIIYGGGGGGGIEEKRVG